MARRERNEKEEKEEKGREEKWRRDPLSAITWAAILIWVGVALLIANFDLLTFTWDTWAIIFTGIGVILLAQALIRYLMPQYRMGVTSALILGLIFLAIGLGGTFGWGVIWPVVLIIIGILIILSGLLRRR